MTMKKSVFLVLLKSIAIDATHRARTLLSCLLLILLSGCIGAGKNSTMVAQQQGYFPHLQGIDLLGVARKIPQSFAGSLNLVVVAFKREQQSIINPWITVADNIMADHQQLRFYEIPLVYELNPVYRTWVNNGMRSGIPSPIARERTITVYTDRDKFTTLMNMDTETIYIVLLDTSGKVLWREQGAVSEIKIQRLIEFLKQIHSDSSVSVVTK